MAEVINFDEIAENVFKALGGVEGITYANYQAFIKALDPAKEIAKNNSHVRTEEAKANSEAAAQELKNYIRVGDQVTYLLKSYKAVIGNIRVNKVTDKRFHVELTSGTHAVVNGKEQTCGDIAGLTIGKKYVDFKAIQTVNDKPVDQFLKDIKAERAENRKDGSVATQFIDDANASTKAKHDAVRAKIAAEIDAQAMKNVAE